MKKVRYFLQRFAPFSYLFLISLCIQLVKIVFRLAWGNASGKIVSTLVGLGSLYQYGILVLFAVWILVNGIAALFSKRVPLKELIFSLIPLVVLLGIMEGIFRFVPNKCADQVADVSVQAIYHPDSINQISETRARHGQLNGYGFRGSDFSFDKKQDEYVIVLLGGSVATGAYAADYNNIPSVYIENHLKDFIQEKYHKRLKVYSLAEAAADIEDEAFWLFKLGVHMKPDAVVSLTGYNNMHHALMFPYWDFSSGARGFRRPGIKIVQNLGVNKIGQDMAAFVESKLTKYSATYRFVKCRLVKDADPVKSENQFAAIKKDEVRSKEAARRFWGSVVAMNDFCSANHMKFISVIQPFATCGPSRLNADGSSDNLEQFMYRNLMTSVVQNNDSFAVYDASRNLSDRLDSLNQFADSCHLWDKGFVILDEGVTSYLKGHL